MSLFFPRHSSSSSSPAATPGFSSLFRMLDDFDKYAQSSLANNPFSYPGLTVAASSGLPTIAPKFDLTETDDAYALQGELAGVPPENVTVEFTDPQTMVIRGKVEKERTEGDASLAPAGMIEGGAEAKGGKKAEEKKGEEKKKDGETKYWLSERSYGEFSRTFNFPAGVDQEKVEAKFENGLLSVRVPKGVKKGARKILVKSA